MNIAIKGAKAGSEKARKAVVAADSAQSITDAKLQYILSEGEIEGLEEGNKSIYLDDTPLQDAGGNDNFQGVDVQFRSGSNDQDYMLGFPDIVSETGINIELKSSTPWVKAFTNLALDRVNVRLRWGALRKTNDENGDVNGYTIQYAIDRQTDGGAWVEVLNTKISDKTSTNYERGHDIDLPKSDSGWQIRVRRLTPNATSEYISDKMYVSAVSEIIDTKFRYPNTATLGIQYNAETFSSVAKMAARCKGIKLLVPSNYNPDNHTYTGFWDGTFKRAYSNNPAWIFYDLCTNKRYGLGNRLDASMIDKASLYRVGQYCDQMIPDGKGGQEPRFTCNVYIQSAEDAYTVLNKVAGVFRGYTYWDGEKIVVDADMPQDTMYTFTRANVIDGHFERNGARARDQHNVAKVAWDNPDNRFKTEYEFIRDEASIASSLGIRTVELEAWGCTSQGQAQRAGQWALKSEQLETQTITFKIGLDGLIRDERGLPMVGKVIEVADAVYAGRDNGGRIAAVSANLKTITLDRDDVVCRSGDRLVVNGENGQAQTRIVSAVSGRKITVSMAFDAVAAQNVWVIDAQDLATMKFRVISITQDDKHQFTITGLQYNPQKYDAIDYGAYIDDRPISIVNPTMQAPVTNVVIAAENMVQQGLTVATMLITWDQAAAATKYQVEWRKDDGSWIKLPISGNNSAEVQGIYSGKYQARVTAINAFDIASLPTYSLLTILQGKQGKPPKLAFINAIGILFGMKLDWGFPAVGALDTAYTEIEVSPDAVSNIARLGLFAYPTTTHSIQGMLPNLKQFYRGRLIDRIGNIGDWSDWVSGTTSADASAVLEILNGKIKEEQLHQDLQKEIGKIDGFDQRISDAEQSVVEVDNKVSGVIESQANIIEDQVILSEKIDGVYARTNPLTADGNWTADGTSTEATAWNLYSATIEGDYASAELTRQAQAQQNGVNALFQEKITAVTNGQTATANQVSTLQTTVGQNTASVQEVTQSVNGLYAQKFTKLDVNGKVIGWGGANDGVEGKYIFNVDSLAIGSGGSAGYYPFIFRTTPFTDPVTGTVFPVSAYLKSAMMDYQSVKTSHIEDLAVGSAKIKDAAITNAKIENLAVGSAKIADAAITTAKIGDLQVDTLKIKGNAVSLPVSASTDTSMGIGDAWATVQQLNIPADMGAVLATFSALFNFGTAAYKQIIVARVMINGVSLFGDMRVYIYDGGSARNGGSIVIPYLITNNIAGIYEFQLRRSDGTDCTIYNRVISAIAFRR